MIDITIALYVISILTTLGKVAYITILSTIIISAIGLFVSAAITDFFRYVDTDLAKFILKYVKRYMPFVALPALIAFIAIPSERTMYMIAGLYASDKALSSVQDSEIAKQAERTLLAKLQELEKEYLTEEKPND